MQQSRPDVGGNLLIYPQYQWSICRSRAKRDIIYPCYSIIHEAQWTIIHEAWQAYLEWVNTGFKVPMVQPGLNVPCFQVSNLPPHYRCWIYMYKRYTQTEHMPGLQVPTVPPGNRCRVYKYQRYPQSHLHNPKTLRLNI